MTCKKCGEADESKYYSGIKTYCKEHWRERVRENRAAKSEYYKDFDRKRANLPHRVAARKAYAKTEEGKVAGNRAKRKWSEKNAIAKGASALVNNAVKSGKLTKPLKCSSCGSVGRIEGHHEDYEKPLKVIWLCSLCHRALHKEKTT